MKLPRERSDHGDARYLKDRERNDVPRQFWLVLFPDWSVSANYQLFVTTRGLRRAAAKNPEFRGGFELYAIDLDGMSVERAHAIPVANDSKDLGV